MYLSELQKIGLTDGEIKVYQALLDLGECTKTALAKSSGVAPSNVYDITNRLATKGMISKVEKNGVAHFSAASPNRILDFLDEKREEVEKERKIAEQMLPRLLMKFQKTSERADVEVFSGWKGLATVFRDLLNECGRGEENLVFGAGQGKETKQADRFFLKYSRLREEREIETRIIFNEELRARRERVDFFLQSKKYEVRFLRQTTWAEMMVYKDRTVLIVLTGQPVSVRITSKETADSFRQYFELLWKQAKK